MPLECSLIACEPVRFAGQDQTSPAPGVASNAAQQQRWPHCPRTWARSWRPKAVTMRTRPGASFGTAGCPHPEICLPNSRPRLLGVPSPRARVECPACPGISHNTLKFIDLDRAGFSVSETDRPRTDSRLLGSSVDRPTKCRRDEIGWNGACASYAAPSCLLQKAAHAAQRRGCGVAISSGTANPKSFPSIPDRPTGSPRSSQSTTGISSLHSWRPP